MKISTLAIVAVVSVMTSAAVSAEELIANGSFESYTGTVSEHNGDWESLSKNNFTLSGWTCGWASSNGDVGLTKASGVWLKSGIVMFEGEYALYMQKVSSITQTIDVATAGRHEISFGFVARPHATSPNAYVNGILHVEIDGVEAGKVSCGTYVNHFQLARIGADISAGQHVFVIRHDPSENANACTAIDNVSVKLKAADTFDESAGSLLTNGSFERCDSFPLFQYGALLDVGTRTNWLSNVNVNGLTGWTSTQLMRTGMTMPPSSMAKTEAAADGDFALWFYRDGALSQNFTAPETGRYEISFKFAPRSSSRTAGSTISVFVDGEPVGSVVNDDMTTDWRFYTCSTVIPAGEHIFSITNSAANDNSGSLVDAVALCATSNLVQNGGFEAGFVQAGSYLNSISPYFTNPHWNCNDGNMGLSEPGSSMTPFTNNIPANAGSHVMFIQSSNFTNDYADASTTHRIYPEARIWQTVSVLKPGLYRLDFDHARRRDYPDVRTGTLRARIVKGDGIDGTVVGEWTVNVTDISPFGHSSETVKLREAGTYTIEFYVPQPEYAVYTTSQRTNEATVILDNVSLVFQKPLPGMAIIVR